MVSTRAPSSEPAALRSPDTCTASSRVGAITSACGAAPGPSGHVDAVQQRDAEAEGLAGSGAGLPDEVAARERDRQREFLDREGLDDADRGQRADDLGADVVLGERGAGVADDGPGGQRGDLNVGRFVISWVN